MRVALAISALMLVFSASVDSRGDETIVGVVREDGGGYSDVDLTQEALPALEASLVDMLYEKARAALAQNGGDPSKFKKDSFRADSHIVELGEQRIAVVTVTTSKMSMKALISVEGKEFVRVTCLRVDGSVVLLTSPNCSAQISKSFGIDWPG